jgi:hypothetical protein
MGGSIDGLKALLKYNLTEEEKKKHTNVTKELAKDWGRVSKMLH